MKSIYNNYKEKMLNLSKNDITKDIIISRKFLIDKKDNIEIYYAPHNEYFNKEARIVIVGICPGWSQTKIAYETFLDGLQKGLSEIEILKDCKYAARFAGSMRKNIISMLDDLKIDQYLNMKSTSELFENNINLHTTSLIPYPVFVHGKNYTGHNPNLVESEFLMSYVCNHFYEEVKRLKKVFIIPLGLAVEEVLYFMIKENLIEESQCLFGFPHPSGANGHRKEIFKKNKHNLEEKIKNYFDKESRG